jgi:hypothetical protein
MACLPNEISTDIGCIPNTPAGFTQKFFNAGMGMIGGFALLGMIYGTILIITSRGDSVQVKRGKKIFTSSILGMALVVFSVFFVKLIAVNILHLPGF